VDEILVEEPQNSESAARRQEPTTTLMLPGFSMLSKDIISQCRGSNHSKERNSIEDLVQRDFERYELSAKAVLGKAVTKAELKHKDDQENNKAVIVQPDDPLDFWLRQVGVFSH
jgi:hypothetical protein